VLQHAVQQAARGRQWDAAVVLIRHLGGQDRPAAKSLLAGVLAGDPAAALAVQQSLLASWLDSETEQQRAALKQEAQEVARQRAGLQQLLIGVAGTHKRIEAAHAAAAVSAAAEDVREYSASHADKGGQAAAAHLTSGQVKGAQTAEASSAKVRRSVSKLATLVGAVMVVRLDW
jgi:hypothetical protein